MNPSQTLITRDNNKKLVKIIQSLLSCEQSIYFRKPVAHKSLGWIDYRQIVKKPVDLNLIRRQYNQGKYKTVEEVLNQIQTVWDNVFMYDQKNHQSYTQATKMLNVFNTLIDQQIPQFKDKIVRYQAKKQQNKIKPTQNNNSTQKRNERVIQPQIEEQNIVQVQLSSRNRKRTSPVIQKDALISQIPVIKLIPILHNEPNETPRKLVKQQKQGSSSLQKSKRPLPQALPLHVQIPVIQQQSSQNPLSHVQPIRVNLRQSPSNQQVKQLTQTMHELYKFQQLETMTKVVAILTKYQKEHMIVDGEYVRFNIHNIHISTYNRIKKEIQAKPFKANHYNNKYNQNLNINHNHNHSYSNNLNNIDNNTINNNINKIPEEL